MHFSEISPILTRSLFSKGRDFVDRVVLEYSDTGGHIGPLRSGTLGLITYDHLVPFHPIYENNFEFYGPDGSFDGLEFSGGLWILPGGYRCQEPRLTIRQF